MNIDLAIARKWIFVHPAKTSILAASTLLLPSALRLVALVVSRLLLASLALSVFPVINERRFLNDALIDINAFPVLALITPCIPSAYNLEPATFSNHVGQILRLFLPNNAINKIRLRLIIPLESAADG
jgi:hypothetical protein